MLRLVASLAAVLALTTGCSVLRPAASPEPVAAEADPWQNFNNGYAKGEAPSDGKSKPAEKTADAKTDKTSAALEDKAVAADDEAPKKTAKAGKKGAKKKGAGSSVATKKPRKRAKKA